ncbi:MAG TPA: CocE/NonD family hydrolase [Phycisphaerae bacterium]|nr:CocE/NonD family hydrolase [Phycisphaerae bacterium]HOJ72722.1 CocE/NonD family hydrolase [Phycisphaerae bacterium]HOM53505.1 CocE/NonD family hydrolase [Phycisphaerae bacterium]HON65794.1 CocE/NonD family hydrolase [Phycisphaerae bacterium]HPP26913.1 CocE/NonD family hydrolase [Phycisphaerae bacterium]
MKCTRFGGVALLLLAAAGVGAEAPRPTLTEQVAMTDGTLLATDVYLPDSGDGSWPALLIRTPYNKDRYNNEFDPFARRGYAVVIQDMRGRFGSQGRDLAFMDCGGNENNDGHDTVQWIARQPWCNGRVGTLGASAMGITQNMMARTAPPNLVAQYIMVAAGSLYQHGAYNTGGAMRLEVSLAYTLDNALSPSNMWLNVLHPMYDDHWRRMDATIGIENANVPAVHYGGWYDCFLPGTLTTFTARQERGGHGARGTQKLLIGPWAHGGPGTDARPHSIGEFQFPPNIRKLPVPIGINEWFDHYLQGRNTGADRAPAVVYYTMGAIDEPGAPGNVWHTDHTWPPPHERRRLYLHADGRLTWKPPQHNDDAARTLTSDPLNPVPTRGGANLAIPAGAFDQREIEKRPDVLVFTTEPLTEPVEVTGPVVANLLVTSDCPDTDFAVKLCDVYPDGRSMNICDGLLRLRHRRGADRLDLLEPGEVVSVRVDMDATSIVFNRGHRIRVHVTGSNYPRFDVNPNTGWPAWPFCPVRVAKNTVFCSADRASCVELPVVTREADGTIRRAHGQ